MNKIFFQSRLAKANNPWAICHGTLPKGTSKKKFESCVQQVKKKASFQGIIATLDRIADTLEAQGKRVLAKRIDRITNTIHARMTQVS